ncbi:hypothetical protein D3C80_1749330 [compost metagenome]
MHIIYIADNILMAQHYSFWCTGSTGGVNDRCNIRIGSLLPYVIHCSQVICRWLYFTGFPVWHTGFFLKSIYPFQHRHFIFLLHNLVVQGCCMYKAALHTGFIEDANHLGHRNIRI